jgi:hypothetical protein
MNSIMNTYREGHSNDPFPSAEVVGDPPDSHGHHPGHCLPLGWRRLSTGVRGTRLYRVEPPGGTLHWAVGITMHGEPVLRRFASELHARAWLSIASEPPFPVRSTDLKLLNQAVRESSAGSAGYNARPQTAFA